MNLGREAGLQVAGAAALWLLAAASLPTVLIANALLASSGADAPVDRALAVLLYDVLLIAALWFFHRSKRSKAAKIILGTLLLPLAIVGVITLREQIAAESSDAIIRKPHHA